MEKLSGGTLWDRFTSDGLAPQTACAAILATAAALHCAHQQGILHRDIKPENLIFSGSGTLKVTDFGISKMLTGTTTKMTAAGEILGTPAYMAPEQAASAELSPATDICARAPDHRRPRRRRGGLAGPAGRAAPGQRGADAPRTSDNAPGNGARAAGHRHRARLRWHRVSPARAEAAERHREQRGRPRRG